jgi:F-type H+-transporting ATPase subunit delta
MASSKVAVRYASSFLGTAIEKNILDRVSGDIELIYNSLYKNKELKRAIDSPIIKNETKSSILTAIFGNKISEETLSYLNFVILKGRENILTEILEKFIYLKDEHLGVANVHVTTAFDFTAEQKIHLQEKFASHLNKKIKLDYTIDEKIIGGFIAKVGDTVYNASITHQLDLLKEQFLHGSVNLN